MEETILQAALDYIEGWYQGDTARMDRVLHPKLAKRRVSPTGGIWEVSKDWMIEATGDGRGRIEDPQNGHKVITILDTTETMACVKIVSEEFVDYVHLGRDGRRWVIVNVLWDYA